MTGKYCDNSNDMRNRARKDIGWSDKMAEHRMSDKCSENPVIRKYCDNSNDMRTTARKDIRWSDKMAGYRMSDRCTESNQVIMIDTTESAMG